MAMTLKELLYSEVIPKIKSGDRSTMIGEGTQAEIYDKFICKAHSQLCYKVFYPCGELARDEYAVLSALYAKKLSVPKPLELFDEENAYAMEKLNGITIEQAIKRGLKISEDVLESAIDEINAVTAYVNHGDLSTRNVMLCELDIEDNIIIDAITYVIDFGLSKLYVNKGASEEGANVIRALRKITVKGA